MLIEQEVQRLFTELVQYDRTQIELGGEVVTITTFDNGAKFLLSTPVFKGGSYIPQSVRHCLSKGLQIGDGSIRCFPKIEEEQFTVYLHYLGVTRGLNPDRFRELLEEFAWIADEWRYLLDEHGKRDLIHVPL